MREALDSLPWARNAEIQFEKQQATVTVDTEEYEPEALIQALEAAGFGGKPALDDEAPEADQEELGTPEDVQVSFRVMGMKKAKSGAT